ncbi:transglutaminase-like domain-containing protein [Clostridium gasigenes]|uniref:transglutaminase-like domain-containing protein n=1 Tax=Clostridium gasigenes TaxID=94869 RepID=UPI001C0E0CDE|nr:transglutaminase-like domain-containing protein [Clostridium gasigenes]MBU3089075.1 transglutaminase-like domain-containing protein [Clostridium gasigenes]
MYRLFGKVMVCLLALSVSMGDAVTCNTQLADNSKSIKNKENIVMAKKNDEVKNDVNKNLDIISRKENSDSIDNENISNKEENNTLVSNKISTAQESSKVVEMNSKQNNAIVENTDSQNEETKVSSVQESIPPVLDDGGKDEGVIKVKYLNVTGKKLKIGIMKDEKNYYHNFSGNGEFEIFSFQGGSGNYVVTLFENTTESKYKPLKSWQVNVKIYNENAVYTTSTNMINWNNAPYAVNKARQLTQGVEDNQKKAEIIYNYVVNNYTYDIQKAKSVSNGYVVNIDSIFNDKLGICSDFAVLYAGMLRSVDVPVKFVTGNSENIEGYHGWNEIYVNENWQVVDTSYDSQLKSANKSVGMYKSGSSYSKNKEY